MKVCQTKPSLHSASDTSYSASLDLSFLCPQNEKNYTYRFLGINIMCIKIVAQCLSHRRWGVSGSS